MLANERHGGISIVERSDQYFLLDMLRDTSRIRHRLREVTASLRRHAHQRIIIHAMEATLELEDLVLLAEGPGRPHCIERGLGATRDKPHLFGTGDSIDDILCEQNSVLIIGKERRPLRRLLLDRGQDIRMAVTDKHRPGAKQIVDVLVATDIPYATAFTTSDDRPGTFIAKTARRQNLRRRLAKFAFFLAQGLSRHDLSPKFHCERV